MADEKLRVDYDIDVSDVKAAEQATKALKAASDQAADSAGKVEGAAKKAGKGAGDFGRSALETGRILQDFAQGGVGGVINNLEVLSMALGLGAGVAGVATLAGVAFLTLRKPVADAFDALINGANEVPKATDALSRMNEQLDTSKGRLKDLAKEQTLTNTELAEFKTLQEEVLRLEKATNDERERRNALEAARKQERDATRDPAAAKAATKAVTDAGGVDKVVADLTPELVEEARKDAEKGLRDLRDKYADALKRAGGNTWNTQAMKEFYEPKIREAEAAAKQAAQQGGAGRAADLVTAARQGDQAAIEELNRRRPGMGFEDATTFGVARTAAGEEQAKRDREWQSKQAKKADERKAAREKEQAAADAEEDEFEANKAREERRQQDAETRAMNQAGAEAKREAEREEKERPAKERQALQDRAKNAALVKEGRERGQLQQYAAQEFGVDLRGDQLDQAAAVMKQFAGAGASFEQAAGGAIGQVIQNQMDIANKLQEMAGFWQQQRQQAARVPGLLQWGAGQDEAQGAAANPWAAINQLAAQVQGLQRQAASYRATILEHEHWAEWMRRNQQTSGTLLSRGRIEAPVDATDAGADLNILVAEVEDNAARLDALQGGPAATALMQRQTELMHQVAALWSQVKAEAARGAQLARYVDYQADRAREGQQVGRGRLKRNRR